MHDIDIQAVIALFRRSNAISAVDSAGMPFVGRGETLYKVGNNASIGASTLLILLQMEAEKVGGTVRDITVLLNSEDEPVLYLKSSGPIKDVLNKSLV